MDNPFARTPLVKYRQLIAATRGNHKVFNGVELDQCQMAVVLKIHDYGLEGITAEEKQLLYTLIAELKNHIHP